MTWALRGWCIVVAGTQVLKSDKPAYVPSYSLAAGALLNLSAPQSPHPQSGDDGHSHLMKRLGQRVMCSVNKWWVLFYPVLQ